jgi:hypothetical protein
MLSKATFVNTTLRTALRTAALEALSGKKLVTSPNDKPTVSGILALVSTIAVREHQTCTPAAACGPGLQRAAPSNGRARPGHR